MKNPLGNRWSLLEYHPTQQKLFLNPVRFPVVPSGRRCLAKGTLVSTANGGIPIEKLKIGDEIIGYNEFGKPEITTVKNVFDNGSNEVISLISHNNKIVEATKEHKFLICNEKIVDKFYNEKLSNIYRWHRIKKCDCRHLIIGGNKSINHTYVLGAFIGNGCCRDGASKLSNGKRKHNLNISCDTHIIPEYIAKVLKCTYRKASEKNYTWVIEYGKNVINSIPFYKDWCYNKYSYEKKSDWNEINTWDKNSCMSFLAGLIDTDGSIYFKKKDKKEIVIQLGLNSQEVIKCASNIIFKFCQFKPSFYIDSREKYKGHDIYTIKTKSNYEALVLLEELKPYLIKRGNIDVSNIKFRNVLSDRIGLIKAKTRIVKTYDIEVNNNTNLYVLHNCGLVTHNSGKTELAKRYLSIQALTQKTDYETNFYFACAPTREQAKRIFWDDLKELTKMFHSSRPNESDLIICTEFDGIKSKIQVMGLERPERIEGSPWNGGIIDEMRKIKPFTWYKHIRPALADRNGWCWRCGVPEGRNEYYEMAIQAGGGIPQTIPKIGVFAQGKDPEQAYYSWFSADILPDKEVESARLTLDPKTFRQEFEGSFEAEEGRVYYAYTPDYYPNGNLHKVEYDKNLPVYIGFDFNVSPMTAIIGHIRIKEQKEFLEVFKGYHIKNCNTKTLCEMILNDFSESYTYIITTCQSGQNRQTVADLGLTDRKIIQNEFLRRGKNIQFNNRNKNPLVRNKINATNSMLYHNRILINYDDSGCKELIKDFESLVFKEGSSDIDTSDPMRGHISDALGYIIERNWPVVIDEELQSDLSNLVL